MQTDCRSKGVSHASTTRAVDIICIFQSKSSPRAKLAMSSFLDGVVRSCKEAQVVSLTHEYSSLMCDLLILSLCRWKTSCQKNDSGSVAATDLPFFTNVLYTSVDDCYWETAESRFT